MTQTFVIVGANLAGGRAAEALRTEGFDGRIVLVGEEPWRPYERPPLSKELLWEPDVGLDRFYLQSEEFYADKEIDLRLGMRAERLDLPGGRVVLQSGENIAADKILLCTGGSARMLPVPGADLEGVLCLRTYGDAQILAKGLKPGAKVMIVGLGVIGGEVAASARKRGCEVTAIEAAPVPMARALGPRFGAWLAGVHRDHGVALHLGTGVERFVGEGGKVAGVVTSDGVRHDADMVVVGVGIKPATELAEGAGLMVDNGIVVDRQCRTSNPQIFAAGDVANQPGFLDGRIRLETFQNAQEQGMAAATAMVGKPVEYRRAPWFWSDQYDLNIQVVGCLPADARIIVRGDENSQKFAAFFVQGKFVEGVITVNRPPDMAVGRRLVEQRQEIEAADVLGDESVQLRSLLARKPA